MKEDGALFRHLLSHAIRLEGSDLKGSEKGSSSALDLPYRRKAQVTLCNSRLA